ncbi:hypothetical protein EJB05_33501 [Eragrostis curvula]|uniref:Uncharacterized protein n=1 Tax=Eragrostis curvula TaxID=38414 RepID=A0A5J9U1A1_9POAL|nr:hypothetical protein EJB05_33501 [Eragrostis curvula]
MTTAPVLDLSSASDGPVRGAATQDNSAKHRVDYGRLGQVLCCLPSFVGVHGKREEGVLPNSGDGGVLLAKAQEGASEGRRVKMDYFEDGAEY